MLVPLRDHLQEGGLDAAQVLRSVGIDPEVFEDPDGRVKAAKGLRLWDEAARQLGDPLLGLHVAARVTRDSFDLLSQVASVSDTFREMGERIARYHALAAPQTLYTLREEGPWAWWLVPAPPVADDIFRQVQEFALAVGWVYTRSWGGEDCGIRRVHFAHRAGAPAEHYETFFRVPVHFEQAETGFEIPSAVLDRPLASADAALASVLDSYATQCVQKVPGPDSLMDRLQARLLSQLPEGEPRLTDVARALGLSTRTLQRRLGQEGSSFQAVLDALRRGLALRHMDDAHTPLSEVAARLGFSDTAVFRRAFKRWTGLSPSAYRQQQKPERP